MIKSWDDKAWADYEYWLETDRKKIKQITRLLKDIDRGGYEGLGDPEPLKGNLSGLWSRKIDEEHRLVYYIDGDTIYIAQCRGHYDDK